MLVLTFVCSFINFIVIRNLLLTKLMNHCAIFTAHSKALQALYMLRQILPSVCPSVRKTPKLCQNDGTQRDAVSTIR